MVKFGRCGDDVFEAIQCSACEKHFDYPCSGISEAGYRKLGDRKSKWKCLSCKDSGKSSGTSNPSSSPSPSITLESIMRELSKINLKHVPLSTLAEDIREVKTELANLKTTTSEFATKVTSLEKRVLDIENAQEDVVSLKKLVSKLEVSLDEKDQWLRMNNLEIKGVPMRDRENLFDVISKIANKISYPVNKTQINFVHRVSTNVTGQKNIVVLLQTDFRRMIL